MRSDYILTLSCPDRTGIVYRVTGLLFDLACNILDAQQFGDDESGRFFLRVHFHKPAKTDIAALQQRFAALADESRWTGNCTTPVVARACWCW